MTDAKREILEKVRTGAMTAEEAAIELESLEAGGRTTPAPAPETPAPTGSVAQVRVQSDLGSVTVLGDETVLEAVAEGPHRAYRQGDTIVIESGDDNPANSFVFGGRGRFGLNRNPVTVRMNPRLPLDADVQAGSLRVRGVRGPIHAEVQAGSTRIEGFESPIELDCQAGSIRANGRLTEGRSRIRCQAGKVAIELDPASSVKITARTTLGRVTLPSGPGYTGIGEGGATAQVGAGAATLEITSEMGSVDVEVAR